MNTRHLFAGLATAMAVAVGFGLPAVADDNGLSPRAAAAEDQIQACETAHTAALAAARAQEDAIERARERVREIAEAAEHRVRGADAELKGAAARERVEALNEDETENEVRDARPKAPDFAELAKEACDEVNETEVEQVEAPQAPEVKIEVETHHDGGGIDGSGH
jgi:hypothetical protein